MSSHYYLWNKINNTNFSQYIVCDSQLYSWTSSVPYSRRRNLRLRTSVDSSVFNIQETVHFASLNVLIARYMLRPIAAYYAPPALGVINSGGLPIRQNRQLPKAWCGGPARSL